MYFLLKSEVETIDIEKKYYKKRVYCPFCFKTQLKKLDSNDFYIKYHCWNKNYGLYQNGLKIPNLFLDGWLEKLKRN